MPRDLHLESETGRLVFEPVLDEKGPEPGDSLTPRELLLTRFPDAEAQPEALVRVALAEAPPTVVIPTDEVRHMLESRLPYETNEQNAHMRMLMGTPEPGKQLKIEDSFGTAVEYEIIDMDDARCLLRRLS